MIHVNVCQNQYSIVKQNKVEIKIKKIPTEIKYNINKMKKFSLKSRIRQGCPLSPLLFNITPGLLAQQSKKDKIKGRH